jgi:hypothetical protein
MPDGLAGGLEVLSGSFGLHKQPSVSTECLVSPQGLAPGSETKPLASFYALLPRE